MYWNINHFETKIEVVNTQLKDLLKTIKLVLKKIWKTQQKNKSNLEPTSGVKLS